VDEDSVAYLIGSLFCQKLPHIDADEATSWDVIKTPQAPASVDTDTNDTSVHKSKWINSVCMKPPPLSTCLLLPL